MAIIFTVAGFTLLVALCGTLLSRQVTSGASGLIGDVTDWGFAGGVIGVFLILVNANLWFPGSSLYTGLVVISLVAALRLWFVPEIARSTLPKIALMVSSVTLATGFIWLSLDGAQIWLVEGSNHDSIFYFQGAAWAWASPLHVDPEQVKAAWNLGTCRQGGVFIGTDCIGYRAGTYSLLSLGQAAGLPTTGNSAMASAGLVIVFPALAMGFISSRGEWVAAGSWKLSAGTFVVIVATTLTVFLSPGMLSAIMNANIATAFGAACLAMLLGMCFAQPTGSHAKAAVLGMGAGLAGHVYGEAALPAGFLAAVGIIGDSVRSRRPSFIITGGTVSLTFWLLSLNVVAVQLFESISQIAGIATGGEWASWYLHHWPGYWLVAPIAGSLLGSDPIVTTASIVAAGTMLVSMLGLVAVNRNLWFPALGFAALSAILIGYVELRAYSYGEHKVLQLLGPAVFMLAAAALIQRLPRLSGIWIWVRVVLALSMAASCLHYCSRAATFIDNWATLHELSSDFSETLSDVAPGDVVLLDDQAALGVEKFQKAHYLGFLVHERGARMVMPRIQDDALRGGYLRIPLGGSLETSAVPRWLLQLRSETGLKSLVRYSSGVSEGREYQLVDLDIVPGAAVTANGWYTCEAAHCWTHDGFQVETVVRQGCTAGQAHLQLEASFFDPPPAALVVARTESGAVAEFAADGVQLVELPLRRGWDRVVVNASWATKSPAELGLSEDGRRLFAMVKSISITCDLGSSPDPNHQVPKNDQ